MLGSKIENLRKSRGLTQRELGELLGVSPSTIGMYEQNRRTPRGPILSLLAKVLDVSVDFLINEDSETVDTTVTPKKFQLFVERCEGTLVISDRKVMYKTTDGDIQELSPHEVTTLIQEVSKKGDTD